MKRFLSLIITLVLMLSVTCPQLSVRAEGTASIVSPADGDVISEDITEIELALPSECNTVILYLNGTELVGTLTDNIFTIDTEKTPIVYGEHSLELFVVDNNGSVYTDNISFKYALKSKCNTIDFENADAEVNKGIKDNAALIHADTAHMKGSSINADAYIKSDDNGDKFLYKKDGSSTGNNSLVAFYIMNDHSEVKSGTVRMEFDLNTNLDYLNLIVGGGRGTTLASNTFWNDSWYGASTTYYAYKRQTGVGNVDGTGESVRIGASVAKDYHCIIDFNIDTGLVKTRFIGNDKDLTSHNQCTAPSSGRGLNSITLAGWSTTYNLDNIKMSILGESDYIGAEGIEYESDSVYYEASDSTPVPRYVSRLRFKVGMNLDADSVTPQNINLILGGSRAVIDNAVYNADDKTVELTLSGVDSITGNGASYIYLSESILLADGSSVGKPSYTYIPFQVKGWITEDCSFYTNGNKVVAKSFVADGTDLSAKLKFSNGDDTAVILTAVLIQTDGDKMVLLSAKDITIPANIKDYEPEEIVAGKVVNTEGADVSLILIDNMQNALYIDSYDLP